MGVKEVIVGAGGINVNPVSEAVPAGAVTTTLPDAPLPTIALIVVAFTTVNDDAATPPKLTEVAPVKFVPVITTVDPVEPLVGANEVIVVWRKVKPAFDPVPAGVVTLTDHVAPLPTTAFNVVVPKSVKEVAGTPPKATCVVPLKLLPCMDTTVPAIPLSGEKISITGAGGI